jgi:cytochrome c oxidase subunit 3
MKTHAIVDLASVEQGGFGHRTISWWGTMAFMALEGMGFVLAIGIFLYIAWLNPQWPVGFKPQDPAVATALTVLLIVSLIPNAMIIRAARNKQNRRMQVLAVVMSLIGVATLVLRYYEFTRLNMRWDDNVYGSVLWTLLGLHTTHLVTDVGETIYMTVLFFTGHSPSGRYTDADDNGFYWVFVVIGWLPLYGLLYWAPRLGAG